MAKEKSTVRLRGGASLVKCCPTFSWDSKFLFCCAGDTVKVLSITSGECVHILKGHRSPVTCVQVNPKNKLQIFSSSLDQTIIKWNYMDGVQLRKFLLHSPILNFWLPKWLDNSVIVLRKTFAGACDLSTCHLVEDKKIKLETVIERCSGDARGVAMGHENEYIVSVQEKGLKIYSFKKKILEEHRVKKEKVTCVTCHPTEYCIAVGMSDGKIQFWWNFLSRTNVVKTTCHWHALPVLHLTFTAEGSYLLSGGHECVLVKWQYNSHHKELLPRMGAPIRFLTCSPDNTMYATAHADNVIQVISSSFSLLHVYQGLTRSHLEQVDSEPIPVGFLIDPRTKCLVTNGKPGHLQFYCLHSDKQLYNLDIVCQNYISPENLKKPTVITDVRQASFDDKGEWLVSLEMWDDGVMTPEIRLKFWHFNESSQMFVLNTRVEMAHQKKVNAVEFQPQLTSSQTELSPMVVTTSNDGNFRLWSLVDDSDIYRASSRWSCESVGFYRGLPAGQAAFSEDGSLLAVAFVSIITIWDPYTNALRTTFNRKDHQDCIQTLQFGLQRCSHLLVSTSKTQLTVWNLLSCSVKWSVSLQVSVLVRDLGSELMAAFTKNRDVFVFKPSDSTPVYAQGTGSHKDIVAAVFLPHVQKSSSKGEELLPWEETAQLYFMNEDQLLLTITSETEDSCSTESIKPVHHNLPQPPMKLLMAKNRKSGVREEKPRLFDAVTGQPGKEFISQMLSTSAMYFHSDISLWGIHGVSTHQQDKQFKTGR
ncbi:WD repeat-containing protein 75-like [Liolophura sinensis]|uniref:WD repeat-containing protein 75-like n=1 Tax=Liolophura sinensis TaxID=3198878 RepID=UPI00315852E4